MVIIKLNLLLLFIYIKVSHCERRIVDGEQVTSEKSYVVYLVKAPISDRTYDYWLCGGALVSKDFILTSAACVEDVHYMYAIAGYRKYVTDQNLDQDDCVKEMKKKIVYTCVPVSYEFDFDDIGKWAYIDIALVKVESPYNFDDARYQIMCSYIPSIIPVNYDTKRQAANVDALTLGWGHTEFWRQRDDNKNYNQEYLRYGSTTIYDNKKCQQEYTDYPELAKIIEKYMICSLEPGHLNDHGVPYSLNQKRSRRAGCITQNQQSMGIQGELCKGEVKSEQPGQAINHPKQEDTRTKETKHNVTNINGTGFVTRIDNRNQTSSLNITDYIYKPGFGYIRGFYNRTSGRRNGICQNDHGGPLVTWVGKREVLIGIASVFKITDDKKCIGPYLYTSTVCNGAFIGCVLGDKRANSLKGQNDTVNTRKALLCDSPPNVRGFDTIESYVSWKDHPDGPADNEKHVSRGREEPNRNVNRDSEEDYNPLSDKNMHNINILKAPPENHEEEPKDRFSLNMGLPPGEELPKRKRPLPRKRPPMKKEPPPLVKTLPETEPPLVVSASPETGAPPVIRASPEKENPPEIKLTPTIRPPPERERSPIIKPPPERKPAPIIRPPLERKPVPIIRPPPERRPAPIIRPSPERERLPIRPPPERVPLPIIRPPPERKPALIIRPLPERERSPIRLPPEKERLLPIIRPPPERKPAPIIRPPPGREPSPIIRPPPERERLPMIRPQPVMKPPEIIRSTPKTQPPAFETSPDLIKKGTFVKNISKKEPSYSGNKPRFYDQPEIRMRPQNPLNG